MNADNQNTPFGGLDSRTFLEVANRFIELANRENVAVSAPDLQMAFLYAAARYNAYVGTALLDVEDPDAYVDHLVERYREMLLRHMADAGLARDGG